MALPSSAPYYGIMATQPMPPWCYILALDLIILVVVTAYPWQLCSIGLRPTNFGLEHPLMSKLDWLSPAARYWLPLAHLLTLNDPHLQDRPMSSISSFHSLVCLAPCFIGDLRMMYECPPVPNTKSRVVEHSKTLTDSHLLSSP